MSLWTGSYIPLFFEALRKVLPELSGKVRENRQFTVGASEIGKCPRWVVADKLRGEPSDQDRDDATCMRFLQGHTREVSLGVVHRQVMRDRGWFLVDQLRVHHPEHPRLRAHIDRVVMDRPEIEDATHLRVLEEKYSASIPEGPRDGWVQQGQFQMGLLRLHYPDKVVDGGPLVSCHDDITDYGGATEFHPELFDRLVARGVQMLRHLDEKVLPPPEPDLLCGWCPHRDDCPAFSDLALAPLCDEVLETLARYKRNCQQKKELEAQQRVLRVQLTHYLFGPERRPKKWRGRIGNEDEMFTVDYSVRAGRKTADLAMLEAEYPEAFRATVGDGEPYDVLQIL